MRATGISLPGTSMRSKLRRLLDGVFTLVWGAGCWLAALGHRRAARWQSSGILRVLVIAPHPDDELACAGTIVLHRRAGDQVTVLHVTDGRRSRAGGLGPDTMAYRRREEARASLHALGVTRGEWLGLPEGEWSDASLAGPLQPLLAELKPQIIYAPSRVDFHPEHYRVASVAARAVKVAADRGVLVRVYQVQVPLTRALVNLATPTRAAFAPVVRAWACYASQESSLRSAWRLRRYAARSHRVPSMAEEFWQMRAAAYAALHADQPVRSLPETFRGIRRSGLTDLLAFVKGRAERRRLRRMVRAVER